MPGADEHEAFPDCAPIFVVGAPRSGTTLLTWILDAHPAIAIADELIYFDIILGARAEVPALDSPERIARFFELLPTMDHVRYWRGMEGVLAEVRRRLMATPRPSYDRLFLLLMQVYAERRGARRFGDKTPWNVRHLERIARMFPNARIIHLVRDPRAHVASRRKLPRTSNDVVTSAVKWKLDLVAARRFASSPLATPASFLELRYEDLVREPEAQVRRVCAFLDERFEPGMLAFHADHDVMFKDQPWKEGVFRPVHAGSLERWRAELSPAQARLIELVCGSEMRRHGYAPDSPAAPLATALQLGTELRQWRRFKREDKARRRRESHIRIVHGSLPLYRLALSHLRSWLDDRARE
jgi:hypothetical protein